MNPDNIVKKEFIYPSENSKKKQWRYTYKCLTCDRVQSKWYRKGTFTGVCSHCSKGGYNTEIFINKSKEHYGEYYDYSKTVYINKRTKLEVICRVHGSFFPRPSDHMAGKSGCPKCALDKVIESCTIPIDIWRDRLSERHKHIELISDKTGYHTKTHFKCGYHGNFDSYLSCILTSPDLCPTCCKLNHQKQSVRLNLLDRTATLYYVYLPSINMYKVGVTTQRLNKRLVGLNFEVIIAISYSYTKAIELENYLHTKLLRFRYIGEEKLIKNGNRELYTVDVKDYILTLLGLQESDLLSKVI